MVTKNGIVFALLEEVDEAVDDLKDQIHYGDWSDDAIHVVVGDAFTSFKHLECLMEALKTVWNNE